MPGPAWDFGEDSKQETALALQALFSAGMDQSRPSVAKGLEFFMEAKADWNNFTVYQYAAIVPVLVATDDDKYRQRTQFAINKLVKTQLPLKGSGFEDSRDDGGWGYGYTADGAHTNMAIYALYAGKQWGWKFLKRPGTAPRNGFDEIRQTLAVGSTILSRAAHLGQLAFMAV